MEALQILSIKSNNIFQSDAWADFQAGLKRKSWVVKEDNIQGLVLKYPLLKRNIITSIDSRLRGNDSSGDKYYFYSPRGPIMNKNIKLQDLKIFLRKVEVLAEQENAVFYRIEPYLLDQADIYKFAHLSDRQEFKKITKHAPVSRQFSPENTLVLDITKPEDKILSEMKSKWRYNINLSKRKGVKVRKGENIEDIKIFYQLTKEMEKRGGYYKGHEYRYYEKMYKTLSKDGTLKLFIAEFEGKPLAAILVSYFGRVATYLHGASGNEKRELMPTYLLQWAAIREAKEKRCQIYDFWGVSPADDKNHPWTGISRFKRGFGGEEISFSGAYDMAFDARYYKLLSTANRFRKILKR